MASQERIAVHNLADLKNTSDDAIPNYLNSLGFKQDNSLLDTRLALGYGAFAVAAACFLWDYKLGFESTKYYTAGAVALYAILNGVLTYWIGFVEKGTIYQGIAPDGSKLSISTSTKKNIPTYNLKITSTPKKGTPTTIELARSFTEWFDSQGHFIARPFQTMFATSVPLIAKADPKRAQAAASATTADFSNLDADVLDAIAASQAASTGAEDSTAGKKSKRRKA
ncbi:microsomal signal peptidase 25 kDa subunit-domain-containing protein [Annulohypoxylon maeteangense]|uniref:microsomal signal peptidase 25 kDa subunit-domain-containing protein n=1 Tax=Annulohypoxylon maeteangense TaxID=1927788 RepID=UPI002007C945|nr:microsomal signal peptidase 25 kDa subunit-domain-containing protein [Annulohypoxylon maeteangense]KAI0889468.1 microsomal signal peptidase 25 kDa subunit-domain-containing protein [Annulohypoxylon maeteangense]